MMKLKCSCDEKNQMNNSKYLFTGGCSHGRSHEYYVESIVSMVQESYPFMAEFCQDWEYFDNGICLHLQDNMIPMGEHARPPRYDGFIFKNNQDLSINVKLII